MALLFLAMLHACAAPKAPLQPSAMRAGVREVDTNGDGKPDLFESRGKKAIDLNHDGKIDITRFYDDGKLSREECDLDFDGAIDAIAYYNAGILIREELGRSTRYYERGKLARRVIDEGKAKYIELYENGEVHRSGYDRDGDGTIDQWLQQAPPLRSTSTKSPK